MVVISVNIWDGSSTVPVTYDRPIGPAVRTLPNIDTSNIYRVLFKGSHAILKSYQAWPPEPPPVEDQPMIFGVELINDQFEPPFVERYKPPKP